MEIPKTLIEARARLMVKAVFFSCILYDQAKLTFMEEGNDGMWRGIPCHTAMTDGWNIVVNMDFFAKLKIEERVFVLAHEVYHVMAMHPKRMRKYATEGLFGLPFVPALYNIAADVVINKCLRMSKIGVAPEGCVKIEKIKDYVVTGAETAEEIYKRLLDDNPSLKKALECVGSGDAEGMLKGDGKDPLGNDVIPNSPDSEADGAVNEAGMKAAVQSAVAQAKSQGTLPAGLKQFIDEFLEPQVHWEDMLRRLITRSAGTESSTWSKPNRRRIVSPGVYLPRRIGIRTGHIVCAIDTSGSVSEKELRQFLGEVSSILGDMRPKSLLLIWCDARVDGTEELDEPEDLRIATVTRGVMGRGGTSFLPPFQYVADNDLPCDTFIYFTDGYGPFPPQEPPYPVIWCMSTDVVPPFGELVRVTF